MNDSISKHRKANLPFSSVSQDDFDVDEQLDLGRRHCSEMDRD